MLSAEHTPTTPDPTRLFREQEILGPARLGPFENRVCTLRLLDDGVPNLTSTGLVNDFSAMQKMRAAARDRGASAEAQFEAMHSPEGLILSNVGVSVVLTTTIGERRFLVGVRQIRPDFNDSVIKLPSGYVNAYSGDRAPSPFGEVASEATVRELAEEALLWRAREDHRSGDLLRGFVSSARSVVARELRVSGDEELPLRLFTGARRPLESPYEGVFPVLDNLTYSLRPAPRPLMLPGIAEAVPVEVDGEWVYAGEYVFQPFQAGQLLFFYELELPTHLEEISLSHCENVMREGALVEEYSRFGAPLLEIDGSDRIAGGTFVLDRGTLHDVTDLRSTSLSEAFVPSVRIGGRATGIVTRGHIKFDEFVQW